MLGSYHPSKAVQHWRILIAPRPGAELDLHRSELFEHYGSEYDKTSIAVALLSWNDQMQDRSHTDQEEFHRREASRCNNAAWDLIEKQDRGADETSELLMLAATARHHWHSVGEPGNNAHADLLFAWAMACAGAAGPAVKVAQTSLAYFEANGVPWERAFAHAAAAAAFAAAGDAPMHARHYDIANKLGGALPEAEADLFVPVFKTIQRLDAKS